MAIPKLDKDTINLDKGLSGPADSLIVALQERYQKREGVNLSKKEIVKLASQIIEERTNE